RRNNVTEARFMRNVWRRGEWAVSAVVAMLAIPSATWASETAPIRHAEIPGDYRSTSGTPKLFVRGDDGEALGRLDRGRLVLRAIDYGSFRLVFVKDEALELLSDPTLSRVEVRDDLDLVGINGWNVDGLAGEPRDLPAARRQAPALFDRQLYVVQFVGPTRDV